MPRTSSVFSVNTSASEGGGSSWTPESLRFREDYCASVAHRLFRGLQRGLSPKECQTLRSRVAHAGRELSSQQAGSILTALADAPERGRGTKTKSDSCPLDITPDTHLRRLLELTKTLRLEGLFSDLVILEWQIQHVEVTADVLDGLMQACRLSTDHALALIFGVSDAEIRSALSPGSPLLESCMVTANSASDCKRVLTLASWVTAVVYDPRRNLDNLTDGLFQEGHEPSSALDFSHALVDTGLRWHLRAFDRRSGEFRDFVITRLVEPTPAAGPILESERESHDHEWNRIVTLDLVPHPNRPHPQITEMDYGMVDGKLTLTLRAATAGYVLRKWTVDASPDHSLDGPEYRLWLKDPLLLYGVRNAAIAPGYRDPRQQWST